MDVLSALPRDVGHVRQILFTLPVLFSLNKANHELFWPLIDNAYSIRQSESVGFRKRDGRPAHVRHHVICRFKRSRAVPSASQGKRASSTKRVITGCDVSFNLLAFSTHYEYYPRSQLKHSDLVTCLQHSHSLDESDANKRNSFLRELVGAEVTNGYPPAESGDESGLSELGKCDCRFARSYWLPCKHVIYAWEILGEIEEPDWADLAEQFDESGFEIYTSRGLVEASVEEKPLSRDLEAKLVTSEALESIRTRFFEVVEISDSLDEEARERLLRRWEGELADYTSAFIGRSVTEWLQRSDEAILF